VQRSSPARTSQSTRNRVSYRELSTDDSDIKSTDKPYPEAPGRKRRRASSPHSSGQQSTGQPSRRRKANSARRPKLNIGAKKVKNSKGDTILKQEDGILRLGGRVPPWQSLPYHILLQIFEHACHPLWTYLFESTPNVAWLLQTALLCRAFAEPALSALYRSPPLCPPTRAHGLISHLASQTASSTFNYRAKVKFLEMEAVTTLTRKYMGREPIDLADLIAHTPQIRGVGIHMLTDAPILHKASHGNVPVNRTVYQTSMIPAMERSKVSLSLWKWNARITGTQFSISKLKDIHQTLPFRNLEEITLVNYQSSRTWKSISEDISGPNEVAVAAPIDRTSEEQLADALKCLPRLKRLRFITSPIVNQKLLYLLPQNLELLEIVDCFIITSEMLDNFLKAHGQNIRELILDHNQALNLSFLVDFAINCPKAETLKMNLTYYQSYFYYQNTDPKFPALLLQGEVPTWPATLQQLELHHLRKWDLKTAESFFSSLVDSASTLPNLRHLNIKASLDESGWRDRVIFRDTWVGRLERVFLRSSPPPNPYLESIDTFKAFKAQSRNSDGVSMLPKDKSIPGLRRKDSNRFSHGEVPKANLDTKSESENDSDVPLALTRRVTRQSARLQPGTSDTSAQISGPLSTKRPSRLHRPRRRRSSDSDSSSEDSALDDDSAGLDTQATSQMDEEQLYIQGMCDTVHILVDNLRPTQEQLNESNFLDEEVSGDEDWVGDDIVPDDRVHAW